MRGYGGSREGNRGWRGWGGGGGVALTNLRRFRLLVATSAFSNSFSRLKRLVLRFRSRREAFSRSNFFLFEPSAPGKAISLIFRARNVSNTCEGDGRKRV